MPLGYGALVPIGDTKLEKGEGVWKKRNSVFVPFWERNEKGMKTELKRNENGKAVSSITALNHLM